MERAAMITRYHTGIKTYTFFHYDLKQMVVEIQDRSNVSAPFYAQLAPTSIQKYWPWH